MEEPPMASTGRAVAIRGGAEGSTIDRFRAEALRETEALARTLLAKIPIGLVIIDPLTRQIELVNDAAATLFGAPPERILGNRCHSFLCPAREGACPICDLGKTVDNAEQQMVRADGSRRPVLKSVIPVQIRGSEKLLECFMDITDRKRAERYQRLSTEILSLLGGELPFSDAIRRILTLVKQETGFDAVGIRLRDGDDFPYYVQEGFPEHFLLTENTLVVHGQDGGTCGGQDGNVRPECTCGLVLEGKTDPTNPLFTQAGSFWTNDSLPLLELPAHADPRFNPRNRCIIDGYRSMALIPIRVQDAIVGLLHLNDQRKDCFTIDLIHLLEGVAASIGVVLKRKYAEEERKRLLGELQTEVQTRQRLAEELREKNEILEKMATTDPLTGLANRRALTDRMAEEVSRCGRYGAPLAVAMIDLDNFKRINDTYGHDVGDRVLKTVAQIISQQTRSADMAARFGGEEFCVLLPNVRLPEAAAAMERIRSAVAADRMEPKVTVSIGVAASPPAPCDAHALFLHADEALYQAKANGKNCVLCAEPSDPKQDACPDPAKNSLRT
jgi:diguanylate cyclase (GGDEF)-like protein/PAS domain S-box-containing protein